LSQLDNTSPFSGISERFISRQDWAQFVQKVLEVTAEAYKGFCQKYTIKQDWEKDTFIIVFGDTLTINVEDTLTITLEDTFTINLVDDIQTMIYKYRLYWNVLPQKFLYTPEMKTGEENSNKAVKIDIELSNWHLSEDDRIYFVWECKLLADINLIRNRILREKHRRLIPEYVTEGMVRFLDEHWKYSSEFDDAGMLGFVLYGAIEEIVNAINLAMINPKPLPKAPTSDQRHLWALMCAQKLSKADHLKACNPNPLDGFVVYQSEHRRAFCGRDIRLHHLFFDFDVQTSTYETDN